MTHMVRMRYLLLTLFFGAFAVLQASAQMKIGNHPTTIHPASILELESNNQALRLTQGDTAQVNTIISSEAASLPDYYSAAEGLIMYNKADSSFYMRMNGWWHRIMPADQVNDQYFKLGGNNITTTSTFLGLKTSAGTDSLRIGTDSTKASIVIMPNGTIHILDSLVGVLAKIDTIYAQTVNVNDTLNVAGGFKVYNDTTKVMNVFVTQDSVLMKNLFNATSADTALLSIDTRGVVHKMSIDSLLTANTTTINGIKSNVFHLKMDSLAAGQTHPWIDSSDVTKDSTIIFHIPIATQTVQGIVNTSTQTFGGTKSFADSVAIGTKATPNSTLQVVGNVSMADTTTSQNINMATGAGDRFRTIICDVSSAASGTGIGVTLPTAVDGRIYTFKKIGSTSDGQISSPVTITTSSGNIDGDTNTFKIYNNFTSVTLQAQGATGWVIIGH